MLEKTYSPAEIETRLYAQWEEQGLFKCGRRPDAKPFTIVIPPPNVTGSLHMGHALNNTIQDILVRFERMRGRDVLWQPGTDHAGIATQMVVERLLQKENNTDRRTMGREAFLERVWEWKEESGGTISAQLRRLGASCDWSRERFTMDEGLSRAVIKVFVQLYKEGLIYKDKRLVNWDPKLHTAISDLEVVQKEIKGHLWHIRYPVEGTDQFIVVATTRPETMLGDTGVAVHPDDERYKDLIGKFVVLPLVGRRIPIVADEYSDPEKGTGAVKITPAHDFNDFEVGKRHDLESDQHPRPVRQTGDSKATSTSRTDANVPAETLALHGLDRFEARKRIVASSKSRVFSTRSSRTRIRCRMATAPDVVIEPWLTEQWYVDAATLAKPAIEAVENRQDRLRPEELGEDLFRMDAQHPALVHLAPALVGPSDSGLVRAGRRNLRRGDRGTGARRRRASLRHARHAHAR